MAEQITLEKALQLVNYVQDNAGKWRVADVCGDLEIGQVALCCALGEKAQKVHVINRIGNYVILENGVGFHVLDDRKGQGIWYLPSHQMTISDPSQNY